MKTRSGKTYFAEGEELCPVCLDSSWSTIGGSRLLCVEGCGCPVPTLHAHCYLSMITSRDVRSDDACDNKQILCPSCTCSIGECKQQILDKAQFNHDLLRKNNLSYSSEAHVMTHAVIEASRAMILSAREYDNETRNNALSLSTNQSYMLAMADTAIHGLTVGSVMDAKRVMGQLRDTIAECLGSNIARMSDVDLATHYASRDLLESRVFFNAGV